MRRRRINWAAPLPPMVMPAMMLLGLPLGAAGAAAPDPGALARCSAIAAPDARLACYDALTNAPPRVTPNPPSMPVAPAPAPLAAPASAPSGSASDPRNFGLSPVQVHKVPEGPASIQARIAKIINTRYGRNSVELDNGQKWAYTDSDQDERLSPGDQVTIKRASLGSFIMNTPSRHSYHMRRTD